MKQEEEEPQHEGRRKRKKKKETGRETIKSYKYLLEKT